MCVEVGDLPQAVLGDIFCYLSLRDLSSAAQVCRGWNSTSKLPWVCQSVARPILDLSEPCNGSWEEHLSILRRWKTWKPQEVPLLLSSRNSYVLLENSTALEVVRADSSMSALFSVRNLLNHEELCQINVQQCGCADIFWGELHGTIWTIRDINGKIFQFDIKTGDCINRFDGEAVQEGSLSVIYADGQEIIASVQNRVQIWDLQQRRLIQAFMIGGAQENFGILRICSTPNFVLCLANMPGEALFLFAINKKDPSIQTKIEVGDCTNPCTFKSSGSYCSLLVGRELHVYEDSSDAQFRLVRTHPIQQGLPLWEGTTQMYKNWVCVYKDGLFCIFDVRNGQEVISLKKDWGLDARFQVNAQALLVFHMFGNLSGRFTSTKLCLYDFSRKVQQLPSCGGCSVM